MEIKINAPEDLADKIIYKFAETIEKQLEKEVKVAREALEIYKSSNNAELQKSLPTREYAVAQSEFLLRCVRKEIERIKKPPKEVYALRWPSGYYRRGYACPQGLLEAELFKTYAEAEEERKTVYWDDVRNTEIVRITMKEETP